MLSNGDRAQQEDKLRRTGLRPYFEAVMASGGLGAAKPDPQVYRLAPDGYAAIDRDTGLAEERFVRR